MISDEARPAVLLNRAFLGLGSNLGDRRENLLRALRLLRDSGQAKIVRVSSIYETDPVGHTDQPRFYNLVAEAQTSLDPYQLLALIRRIETDMGRRRRIRFGPRLIDIDILLCGEETVASRDLQVPHPRMLERAFVILPLAEVAPDLGLPNGETARALAARLAKEQPIRGRFAVPTAEFTN